MYIWTFVEHKEWLQMCSRCSWYPLDRKFENECLHCCLHSESDRSPHHRPGVLHHPGLQESARQDRHQQHRQHRPPHGSGHPDVQPQQCQERHWDINHRLQYYWLHVLLLISLHFSLDDNPGLWSGWASRVVNWEVDPIFLQVWLWKKKELLPIRSLWTR